MTALYILILRMVWHWHMHRTKYLFDRWTMDGKDASYRNYRAAREMAHRARQRLFKLEYGK